VLGITPRSKRLTGGVPSFTWFLYSSDDDQNLGDCFPPPAYVFDFLGSASDRVVILWEEGETVPLPIQAG